VTIPVSNWASSQVTSVAVNIILREIMGYETKLDYIASSGMVYECVADGTFTFNLETWVNTKQAQRSKWVDDMDIVEETPLGYYGREGLFLSNIERAADSLGDDCLKPFLRHWEAYKFEQVLALLPEDKSTVSTLPHSCTNKTHTSCYDGRFIPPHCCAPSGCHEASPHCHEVHLADPSWSVGWFEALIQNLELNLTLAYIGISNNDTIQAVRRASAAGKSTLFYRWWPDPLVTMVGGVRVAFPEYSASCENSHRPENVTASGVACDLEVDVLKVLYHKSLRDTQLKDFLTKMTFSSDEVESMLESLEGGGGASTVDQAACVWVKANFDQWRHWVPMPEVTVLSAATDRVTIIEIVGVVVTMCALCIAGGLLRENAHIMACVPCY
jgi:ABC-type proline/glycine betaine transport system substrate-binding protein